MNPWGAELYGDPCRGCGFTWDRGLVEARGLVAEAPTVFGTLLAGATGTEHHPDLDWSAAAYVCHVSDNLRVWAERLGGRSGGAGPEIGPYDEAALARARRYDLVPLPAARWSLADAVTSWVAALDGAPVGDAVAETVLLHPERGPLSLTDVAVANAHDTFHHQWDVSRILTASGAAASGAAASGPA